MPRNSGEVWGRARLIYVGVEPGVEGTAARTDSSAELHARLERELLQTPMPEPAPTAESNQQNAAYWRALRGETHEFYIWDAAGACAYAEPGHYHTRHHPPSPVRAPHTYCQKVECSHCFGRGILPSSDPHRPGLPCRTCRTYGWRWDDMRPAQRCSWGGGRTCGREGDRCLYCGEAADLLGLDVPRMAGP